MTPGAGTPDPAALAARVSEVRRRIDDAAGRGRGQAVEVVAVTKTFSASAVAGVVEAGVTHVGENRAQELLEKAGSLEGGPGEPEEWHFVGAIQRNKVGKLARWVSTWHSVDRAEVGESIARAASGARVYVQVNLGAEPQKGGCGPAEAPQLVERLRGLGLDVVGLMTVPPVHDDPRPHFAALAALAADAGVTGLSMGMSGDFEVAVEEGATVVRLGSILFGARPR